MRGQRSRVLAYEQKRPPLQPDGFTWRQRVVAMGIVLILLAILVPVVRKVQAEARKAAVMPPPRPTTTIVYPPRGE